MKKITRRKFIYGAALFPIVGSIGAKPFIGDANSSVDKNTILELFHVLALWQIREDLTPEDYLKKRGVKVNDKATIANLSKQDFVNNDLFEVKGLVLAKTEAAAVALLGEKLQFGFS